MRAGQIDGLNTGLATELVAKVETIYGNLKKLLRIKALKPSCGLW